ncbi:MAG: glycosyltransferase 87 family protein [Chloroflexota bacterium]|nr:glycosyltransferase 87 family protein [Chloroflexota bacterium]
MAPRVRLAPRLTVASYGQPLVVLAPQTGGRSLELLIPPLAMRGGDVRLDLLSPAWRPPGESRPLGIAVRHVAWRGLGWTAPPWRQLWVLPGLAFALVLLLNRLHFSRGAGMAAGAIAGVALALGAALSPLHVAPYTHWLLLITCLAHALLILRVALPRILPRSLAGFAVLQFGAYSALWAILHLPKAAPAFDNGWFTPESRYAARVEELPIVAAVLGREYVNLQRALFLLIIVLLSALYGVMLMRFLRQPFAPRTSTLVAYSAVAALPLLFLPRLLSLDVYSYALYGRIAALYGDNPFIARPDQFPNDPLFSYIAWTTTPSVYGPAMIDLSWPLTWLAQALGGGPGVYVLVYKLVAFGAYLGSIAIIKRLLDARWPHRSGWGTLAYAWHPLVLIEFVGSGHNDSVMVLLVLLALLLALRERRLLAVLALVVAGMIKLVALALVPLYVLYTLRTGGSRRIALAIGQTAAGLALVVALYAPYWAGPQTLEVLATAPPLQVMRSGPAAWTQQKLAAQLCSGNSAATQAAQQSGAMPQSREACEARLKARVRAASLGLFFLVYAGLVVWPLRSFAELTDRAAWVLVSYTLLAAISFRSWYVTWTLALVPLMKRPPALLLLWGCTVFLDYIRLPMWERNLVAFVPVLLLVGLTVMRYSRQVFAMPTATRPSQAIDRGTNDPATSNPQSDVRGAGEEQRDDRAGRWGRGGETANESRQSGSV